MKNEKGKKGKRQKKCGQMPLAEGLDLLMAHWYARIR